MTDRKSKNNTRKEWRIVIGNINTFPVDGHMGNATKIDTLYKLIGNEKTDIVIISEHNKNLRHLPHRQQPSTMMKRWWERSSVRSSYLKSKDNSRSEPGGTMIITTARATAHTIKACEDEYGLGRWNYVTLRGRMHHMTTVISVYRPIEAQITASRQLVASIHRRETVQEANDAVDLWFRDLKSLVDSLLGDGHSVIIGGDFNDNLNCRKSRVPKFMESMGLREIMIEKYGAGPATHIRGSTTIDGVFATGDISILRGRYIPFHDSPGDHRWISVDIAESDLIRKPRNDKPPPVLRRTTSKIPSVKRAFQKLLETHILNEGLDKRMELVFKEVYSSRKMDEATAKEYERIELRVQRAVKYADLRCRKVKRRAIPFSPELRQMIGTLLILKQLKIRWELRGQSNRPRKRLIRRLMRKYKYEGPVKFRSREEIMNTIKNAEAQYKQFKPCATEARYSYLMKLAIEHDRDDRRGRQHHYRRLLHIEQVREHYRLLKLKEGKSRKGGVHCVAIGEGEQETISYKKEEIEDEIIKVNKKKLLQAHDTILRSKVYQDLLGEQGDFAKWEQILRKQISLPVDATKELRLWYHYITNYERIECDLEWNTEEYVDSWRGICENKMTTPGIQISHLKCLTSNMASASVISRLALLPLLSGYAPLHWRMGIDSMIPKKVNDIRPEKLRLILLMDARFNHNNKLIGKKMMEIGEKQKWLAPEQFGSRKHKSAIEHALNKRLTFDIIRQQRLSAVYIANDAKSCYDRIILMVAYLTMRNFGIPATVAKSSITCIMEMKHYVKTTYGISKHFYGGDTWEELPHGCGQGNGYGPALWACISSPLFFLMKQQQHGAFFQSPLTNTKLHLAGIAFVDDTDLIETDSNDPNKDVIATAQTALDQWDATLQITGGALEPTKTFWCPIGIPQTPMMAQITIDRHGVRQAIRCCHESEAFFSLGVWQSPSGKEDKQMEHIIEITEKWNKTTSSGNISKYQARTAIGATLGHTLAYSLPATALSDVQCAKIQSTLNKSVLGKMGIARTVSKALACTPTAMGGYGVLDFQTEQLKQHISVVLQHMNKDTITGELLRISLEQYILELGQSGTPFEKNASSYTTQHTWIKSTIESCRCFNITFNGDIPKLQTWMITDEMIMDVMVMKGISNLTVINRVRMYLRVACFSDLLQADCRRFNSKVVMGQLSEDHPAPSKARYTWPRIAEPTTTDKAIWTQAICTVFGIGTNYINTYVTESRWDRRTVPYSQWVYSPHTTTVYQRQAQDAWKTWELTRGSQPRVSRRSQWIMNGETDTLPSDCVPCSVQRSGNSLCVKSFGSGAATRTPVVSYKDNMCHTWLGQNCNLPDVAIRKFVNDIASSKGQAFSDGSKSDYGTVTYAYMLGYSMRAVPLQSIQISEYIHGYNSVPGNKLDCSSYRGELAGILAVITKTNWICEKYGICGGQCTLWSDNKGACIAAFGHKNPTPKWSCYDLLSMIRYQLQRSGIRWKWGHVKSHQDRAREFSTLTEAAQGNIIVDMLASKAHNIRAQWSQQLLPGEPWRCVINDTTCGGNLVGQIQENIVKQRAQRTWTHVLKIPMASQQHYDWELFFRVLQNNTRDRRIWWVKFSSRVHPIGRNLVRRNHQGTAQCPCCGEEENPEHLVACKHREITQAIENFKISFQREMAGFLPCAMARGILDILLAFRRGLMVFDPTVNSEFYQLQVRQFRSGQNAFLAGLWMADWRQYYELFSNYNQSRRKPLTALSHAVNKVQALIFHLWEIRNGILHKESNNKVRQYDNQVVNDRIDMVFRSRPPYQCMVRADVRYFKQHAAQDIKQMPLHKKKRWVEGAEAILRNFTNTQTRQSIRLRSFFQWDPG